VKRTTRQELDASVINDLDRIKEINDKIGQANGIATLDEKGKIPSTQLDINIDGDISIDTDNLTTKEEFETYKSETATQLVQQATEINRLRKVNNEQNKEIAYLKLKQEASDRIEGGTTFADEMNGNSFGIKFDSELSENVLFKNGALTMNQSSMIEHSVDDSVVVNVSSCTTQGNSGKKLVRLDSGTLVCAVKTNNSSTLYKSVDSGRNWVSMFSKTYNTLQDVAIQTDGVYIYCLDCNSNTTVNFRVFNEDGLIDTKIVQHSQTDFNTCSFTINEEGTELHACWSSKNAKSSVLNVQYCKGMIGEDGNVTWGSVEQVTLKSQACQNSAIVLNSKGQAIILYSLSGTAIIASIKNGLAWRESTISGADFNFQYSPSAIFVPKSVNGLENGRIWIAWHCKDSTDKKTNIRVLYSDDDGGTWSKREKLTNETTRDQKAVNITANENNDIFFVWSSENEIKQIKWNRTWGKVEVEKLSNKQLLHPSVLFDDKFEVLFTKPVFIYTVPDTSVNFTGSWTAGNYKPTTEATAVYRIPSTDYVGMFVQKEGNVNIEATINNIPMDSEIKDNEYQFTKALDNEEEVILKLTLSRENTANGNKDKITRMLGGIS